MKTSKKSKLIEESEELSEKGFTGLPEPYECKLLKTPEKLRSLQMIANNYAGKVRKRFPTRFSRKSSSNQSD